MNNTFYTIEQISEMLSLHPKTLHRYIREGKLKAVKFGKGWRVSGHDLSVFLESAGNIQSDVKNRPRTETLVSAVADILVTELDDAIRITNTLTAVLNSKPPEYGGSSMHTQHIVSENKVRVTLWGTPRFIAVMMDAMAAVTELIEDEKERG